MPDEVICVRGLRHRFGDLLAVDDATFSVGEGEIFAFLGPNGAGKTTTIHILTTLLPLQEGAVSVAGFDPSRDPDKVRRSIGIVFQRQVLDRDLTAKETLEFHGRLFEVPAAKRKAQVRELLELVELEEKADTRIKLLSGGMKRRLEIARGLLTSPKVLFLDEPTLGLDPQTRIRIWDYLRKVKEQGTTIFLTTHYMDEADRLSDRICIIDHGRIITTGNPAALKGQIGKDVVQIVTGDGALVSEILQGHVSINEIRIIDNAVFLQLNVDGATTLPDLIHTLQEGGVEISSVTMNRPSMDDVFLHHTGRAMREMQGKPGFSHPHGGIHR